MSPELESNLEKLEQKARQRVATPGSVVRALAQVGADTAVKTIVQLIREDRKVKAEALLEVQRLKKL